MIDEKKFLFDLNLNNGFNEKLFLTLMNSAIANKTITSIKYLKPSYFSTEKEFKVRGGYFKFQFPFQSYRDCIEKLNNKLKLIHFYVADEYKDSVFDLNNLDIVAYNNNSYYGNTNGYPIAFEDKNNKILLFFLSRTVNISEIVLDTRCYKVGIYAYFYDNENDRYTVLQKFSHLL